MKIKYANYILRADNIGDNSQVYALELLYDRMGIEKRDRVIFCRDIKLTSQMEDGCYYILPLVAGDGFYYDLIQIVIDNDVVDHFSFVPLSLGQTRYTFFNEQGLEKFQNIIRHFEMPIGCRDDDSATLYKNIGFSSYTNGCITNIFPKRRQEEGGYNKIYIIDIPGSAKNNIPADILQQGINLTQRIDFQMSSKKMLDVTIQRYNLLRDTAKLVITSRYHIASPCCAMGIPVIMMENDVKIHHWSFDARLQSMNPYIPFYTKEQWTNIDWNPKTIDYEDEKDRMVHFLESRITQAADAARYKYQIKKFFKPSRDRFGAIFVKNRHKIDIWGFTYYLNILFVSKIKKKDFEYYFYGLSERYVQEKRCILLEYMSRNFPDAKFLGFVDSNKRGEFFGKKILSPDKMQINEDRYCFVSAFTANPSVKELFEKRKYDLSHLWLMPKELLFQIYHL